MSGLVAFVAWAALVGWLAAGVLLVLAQRRLGDVERTLTARKWDIVALRAELGAVRRADRGVAPQDLDSPALGSLAPDSPALDEPEDAVRSDRPEPEDATQRDRGEPEDAARSELPEPDDAVRSDRSEPGPASRTGPARRPGVPHLTGATAWRRAHRPRRGSSRRGPN